VVWQPDRSGWPCMSADELSRRAHQLHVLQCGEIEVVGRMPWSRTSTFLLAVPWGDDHAQAIYKPLRGERPLWDFEPGLYRREVAMYVLSESMGFHVVPPPDVREGPLAEVSLQRFFDADHQEHYFTIYEKREDLHDRLRLMAVLDI